MTSPRKRQLPPAASTHGTLAAADPRRRVVIEHVQPQVEGGAYPAKAIIDDELTVTADIFADGHDVLSAALQYRHEEDEDGWQETPLEYINNDRWQATFVPVRLGIHLYRVVAWVDPFKTWLHQFERRVEAGQDVAVDLLIGASMVEAAAKRAAKKAKADGLMLTGFAHALADDGVAEPGELDHGGQPLPGLLQRHPEGETAEHDVAPPRQVSVEDRTDSEQ